MPFSYIYTKRFACIILSILALNACGTQDKKPAKPVTKTQKYSAATFVENLSVAKITLDNGGSLSDISDSGKIIEAYTKQKKTPEANVILVVLEYSKEGGSTQRAVAPIGDNNNFTALSNISAPLNSRAYKIKDVQLMRAVIAPGAPIKITGQDEAKVAQTIKARHLYIADHGHKIPSMQEAELQIKLLRFFTSSKNRDAAYIAADNAKRILSSASHDATVDQLTKELEVAEGELRQNMPY